MSTVLWGGQARDPGTSNSPQNGLLEHPEAHWGVPFHCPHEGRAEVNGIGAKLTYIAEHRESLSLELVQRQL